jgi:hypothetical protein
MRYSSIQLSTPNNTSTLRRSGKRLVERGFYRINLDVGILNPEERDVLFRDGYVISLHKKYINFTSYNIFFTEAHPYFNAGVISTASRPLPKVDKYIYNDLFQELLELFNYKHLQKV